MASDSDLKIFISWSGDLAREVTKVLRAWLPKMFDNVDPWASDVDIDAGLRGLDVIQDRLNLSSFGIIVVTTENQNKSWLNFEAGALSKRLEGDANRVVPLLVNFEDVYQVQGPIRQFQAVHLNEDGMRSLCRSIAAVMGLDALTIDSRFTWAWSDLEAAVERAKELAGQQPEPPELDEKELLSVMFQSIRQMERQVSALSNQTAPPRSRGLSMSLSGADVGEPRPVYRRQASLTPEERAVQEKIAEAASKIREVDWVRHMEYDGKKSVAVRFKDGRDITSAERDILKASEPETRERVFIVTETEG